jgi:hypothetical protein
MQVGRDLFTKQTKAGVTISFRHITQHLIVRPVFLDDIKHVFNRGVITNF